MESGNAIVRAVFAELQQVVLNFVINAEQAVTQQPGEEQRQRHPQRLDEVLDVLLGSALGFDDRRVKQDLDRFESFLAEIAPAGIDRIFFTNSGSESVDTALKIALAYQRAIGLERDPAVRRFLQRRAQRLSLDG